jgi:hypothetical protein
MLAADLGRLDLTYDSINFDLDQHPIIDQFPYFNHRRTGFDIFEELSVCPAIFLPARDIRHEDARSDDILERSSERDQRLFDIVNYLNRLRVPVADSDDFALLIGRRRTGDEDLLADPDGTRITDYRLPLCT